MKSLTAGHKYLLDSFTGNPGQTLQFFERDAGGNVLNDGTTNEEVLAMMIDRLKTLSTS